MNRKRLILYTIPLAAILLIMAWRAVNRSQLDAAQDSFKRHISNFLATPAFKGTETTIMPRLSYSQDFKFLQPSYVFRSSSNGFMLMDSKSMYEGVRGYFSVEPKMDELARVQVAALTILMDPANADEPIARSGECRFEGADCVFFEQHHEMEQEEMVSTLQELRMQIEDLLGRGNVTTYYFRKDNGLFAGLSWTIKGKENMRIVDKLVPAPELKPTDFTPDKMLPPDTVLKLRAAALREQVVKELR